MNENAIKALSKKLEAVAKSSPRHMHSQCDLIVDELFTKHGWMSKLSRNFIGKKLDFILEASYGESGLTSIEPNLKALVKEYEEFSSECQVIIPLTGVNIIVPSIEIGRVTLRQYYGENYKEILDRVRAISMSHKKYNEDDKTWMADRFERTHVSKLKNRACSEITVLGDSEKAVSVALQETRLAIDLIRYVILFLFADNLSEEDKRRSIGIMGDIPTESRHLICIETKGQSLSFKASITSRPFEITANIEEYMREIGVSKLSDMIKKSKPTEFEEIILRAVRWLASAQTQVETDNAFLNLITSLETVFKVRPGEPITASISEGVALLVGKDFTDRKAIKSMIGGFYEQRSRLTHEGRSTVTFEDFAQLTLIVRDFMQVLIEHSSEFGTLQKFKSWLEEQKLSGSVKFPSPAI